MSQGKQKLPKIVYSLCSFNYRTCGILKRNIVSLKNESLFLTDTESRMSFKISFKVSLRIPGLQLQVSWLLDLSFVATEYQDPICTGLVSWLWRTSSQGSLSDPVFFWTSAMNMNVSHIFFRWVCLTRLWQKGK